jgi:prolyl 4-hydroxylase
MHNRDLSFYVRVYDHNLDVELCQRLIRSFESLSRFHKQNGRNIRDELGESAWTELNVTQLSDNSFLGMFRAFTDRALENYNREVGLTIPIPNTPFLSDLMIKRYRPGADERFQLHFDAANQLSNRYLVLLWYLNDVVEGGETIFPQLDLRIEARAGRLLVFPPYWMYQHEGLRPKSGDKYILSNYMLFETPQPQPLSRGSSSVPEGPSGPEGAAQNASYNFPIAPRSCC